MAINNPPKAAYIDYKAQQLFTNIHTPASNSCSNLGPQFTEVCQQALALVSDGVQVSQSDKVERLISSTTTHTNYIFFSLYTTEVQGITKQETLGFMGQFFPKGNTKGNTNANP